MNNISGNTGQVFFTVYIFYNNSKFITADTGEEIIYADTGLQPGCCFNQQHITKIVAQCIIDTFKFIQINKKQGKRLPGNFITFKCPGQIIIKTGAVRQLG